MFNLLIKYVGALFMQTSYPISLSVCATIIMALTPTDVQKAEYNSVIQMLLGCPEMTFTDDFNPDMRLHIADLFADIFKSAYMPNSLVLYVFMHLKEYAKEHPEEQDQRLKVEQYSTIFARPPLRVITFFMPQIAEDFIERQLNLRALLVEGN